jgi:hypothetical protein
MVRKSNHTGLKTSRAKRAPREHPSVNVLAAETLDRKLDRLPDWVKTHALKLLLFHLFTFPDPDVLGRTASADPHALLDSAIRWLTSVHLVLKMLFAKTGLELGEEEALFHLRQLTDLLRDLRDDSPNVFTSGLRRQRSDRRDHRRTREMKDNAARTYKLLVKLHASAIEATEAINDTGHRLASIYEVTWMELTADSLRKRASRVKPFTPKETSEAVYILHQRGRFSDSSSQTRKDEIRMVVFNLLAYSIRSMVLSKTL